MSRIANGVTIPNTEVVAVDIVAALAGISFGNAMKVMMALKVIHETEGVSYDELLKTSSMPTQLADAQSGRFQPTEDFLLQIVNKPIDKDVSRALRLDKRFPVAA